MSTPEPLRRALLAPASEFVTSADGSRINYLSIGSGDAVIVVPGALSVATDYLGFASGLADLFQVHIIERRGRGASDPQGVGYSLAKEREDVLAVHRATGAAFLVGHSFGGLVALETARASDAFAKVAVYEPGVSVDGSMPMGWMPRYEAYLADGKTLDAFVAFSRGTGPRRARQVPHWLMKRLLPRFVPAGRRERMFPLLEQNLREHREIRRADDSWRNYDQITASVLLLAGGKSDIPWVDTAMRRLSDVLPHSRYSEFPSLDHFGIDQGAPVEVAHVIADYLRN